MSWRSIWRCRIRHPGHQLEPAGWKTPAVERVRCARCGLFFAQLSDECGSGRFPWGRRWEEVVIYYRASRRAHDAWVRVWVDGMRKWVWGEDRDPRE